MLAKLTTKNQITLPREVIKEFKGIEYFDAMVKDGRIVILLTISITYNAQKITKLCINGKLFLRDGCHIAVMPEMGKMDLILSLRKVKINGI